MDAQYLEATVAAALVQGLAATVEFQPEDSVEFLGRFLLKFAETEERKAKLKAEAAQLEVETKEAAVKATAARSTQAAADAKVSAADKANADLTAKLANAPILTQEVYTEVLNHIQRTLGATGAYVAVKTGDGGAEDEEPKSSLSYVGACGDHAFMVNKSVTQPKGATFAVWVRPPAPEGEEEEEELDEEGNPKPKPPPPELQPLIIPNVLRNDAIEYFRVPRLGALLAVPFEFQNLDHPGAIPPPAEPAAAGEGEEGAPAPAPTQDGVPAGIPKLTPGAIVLDTLGQHKQFSPSDVATVKYWAGQLASAMNKSQQAEYVIRYKRLEEEKAKVAAEAAAAPPPAAEGDGDAKEEE